MNRIKLRQLRLALFLALLTALAPLSNDMYLPALPILSSHFSISTSLVQLTLTMTTVGIALGQIFAGPVSDYMGRRSPLLLGIIIFCLAALGCVYADNIWLFLLCRFILGFCGASGIVIATAIARDIYEGTDLTRFLAILIMLNGLAPILAPIIGGQILLFGTWRDIFVLLFFIGIMLLLSTLLFTETLPAKMRINNIGCAFKQYIDLFLDHYFFSHCLLQCFTFGAFFAYIAGSSFLFQKIYGVSPQAYSLIFGGIGLGLMLMGSVSAKLAGQVSNIRLLKYATHTSFLGSILLFILFLADGSIFVTYPVLFVTIIPLSVVGASSFSMALAKQGHNAGSASAFLGFSQLLMGGAIMPLVGIAGDDTPIPMVVLMIAGYGLAIWCYYKRIAPEHYHER